MFRCDRGERRNVLFHRLSIHAIECSIPYFSLERVANHARYIRTKLITAKGIVIVFHIDRNRISRARRRE